MSGKITSDVLEARLRCRYKAHLKLGGERGEPHESELLLIESREKVRETATARLLGRHGGHDVPRGLPLDAETLGRGHDLILSPVLEDSDLALTFDALLRVEGESKLGGFHYVPVLFHGAEKPATELRTLLALHGLILAGVQGKEPAVGILIHGRACETRKFKLVGVLRQAKRVLREMRESRVGSLPALRLNDHCTACEFRKRCHAEAVAKDDISLLRGMGEKEIRKYTKRGILTITQLSYTFRPPKRTRKQEDRKFIHSHALQALAIREKKIHVLGSPKLPTSSARIYLDIAGDPERGFDYLLGMIIEANGTEERHSFWADTSGEEVRLFEQLLDLLGRHQDYLVYAYGGYEAAFLRRVGKTAGREEVVGGILARTFNVLSIIYPHIYFPLHSNGLKDIAGHLGFRWTDPKASGLMSVVWRRRWEQTAAPAWKEMLAAYNLEDCEALRRVTVFLEGISRGAAEAGQHAEIPGTEVARVEEMTSGGMHGWNRAIYGLPDFGYINDRASFDYLKDRIRVRTGKPIKVDPGKRPHRWRKNRRVNQEVEINASSCPSCGGTDLTLRPKQCLARLAFDLRITRRGIKGWVTRYRTSWHHCGGCDQRFLPQDYLRLEEFCHSLKSWSMYEYLCHRTSLPSIADTLRECFDLPVQHSQVHAFKQLLAQYYEGTYKRLMEMLVAGHLIHADETEVHLKGVGKAYVWVFTNLEEVVFLYRPSREGDFLHDVLKGFKGVLVSDFYAAYDSLPCPQQKCLVHLLRDFNRDILANPWDAELKSVAGGFGGLLRAVVATVDEHGLRQKHLAKHKPNVDRFFERIAATAYSSEAAEGYRQRLLKCQGKLFTLLDHDGVPWHNNAAEHAVKAFAQYREVAGHLMTEAGLKPYLVLLSLQQTCKYKGVSFLKFLLSRQTDIDSFRQGRRKEPVSGIELRLEGSEACRHSRKRLTSSPSSEREVSKAGRQAEGAEAPCVESPGPSSDHAMGASTPEPDSLSSPELSASPLPSDRALGG